ncbi:hypothetical protein J8Z28_07855 [Pseudoalteromonas sp. SCSIO 43088]|uniref:hypothetical protein n=1 Tax=Pseudoalteromonas sp. SCSIO 43088 TaxID=2822846 RepID=UPI00202B424E|nr:hypothetical protein [Pseudoalteromonas sp. SCSIO 43088]URQ87746.1 hypothetical protein J8Z28_07855 [Pseudoalteromonas sp. SCSIO 43088]
MAGAFSDGLLRGFDMVERYENNEFERNRLSQLDERDERRYQDKLERQAKQDKIEQQRYEEKSAREDKELNSLMDYRDKTLKNTQGEREWQQNYQIQQQQYKKDQGDIALGWQAFREYGEIPETLEEVFKRNPTKDPRRYTDPDLRANVKQLHGMLGEAIKTGQLSKVNDPTFVNLFNTAFKEKISASVGQYDEVVGSKIADVNFAGFVPTERKDGSVALLLQVTYENGAKEQKPMTKGRTSQSDDPVLTFTPKELVGTVNSAATMADMMERPEYWDKMGSQMGVSFGSRGELSKANYQKKLSAIQDDMTKAFAKIQSDSSLGASDDERQQAVERVKNIYLQRIEQLNKAYGIKSKDAPKEKNPKTGSSSGNNDDAEKAKAKKESLANSILNGSASPSSAGPRQPDNGLAEPGFINGFRDGLGGMYKNEAKRIDYSDMSHLDSVLTQTGQTVGSLPGTLGDIGEYIGDKAITPTLDWLTKKPSEKK